MLVSSCLTSILGETGAAGAIPNAILLITLGLGISALRCSSLVYRLRSLSLLDLLGQQLMVLVELVVGEEEVGLVPLSHTVVGELQMEALEVVVVVEEYEVRLVPLSHTVVG